MSSLWKRWQTTVNKKYMRPSPKIRKVLNPCKNILPVVFSYVTGYIKRISLPTLRHHCVEGSMTIEAALVLPLFCLFLMTKGSAIEKKPLQKNHNEPNNQPPPNQNPMKWVEKKKKVNKTQKTINYLIILFFKKNKKK